MRACSNFPSALPSGWSWRGSLSAGGSSGQQCMSSQIWRGRPPHQCLPVPHDTHRHNCALAPQRSEVCTGLGPVARAEGSQALGEGLWRGGMEPGAPLLHLESWGVQVTKMKFREACGQCYPQNRSQNPLSSPHGNWPSVPKSQQAKQQGRDNSKPHSCPRNGTQSWPSGLGHLQARPPFILTPISSEGEGGSKRRQR